MWLFPIPDTVLGMDAKIKRSIGTSLAVQWLGLRALTAKGPGSFPGPRTKIPQAEQFGQKNK